MTSNELRCRIVASHNDAPLGADLNLCGPPHQAQFRFAHLVQSNAPFFELLAESGSNRPLNEALASNF